MNKIGYEYLFENSVKKIGDKVEFNDGNDRYLKGKIINLFPNLRYTVRFDDGQILNVREFELKSFEVRSYEDLDKVLNSRNINTFKTFNILETDSIYKGVEQAFEVLKKNTEEPYRKQIIHDFKYYKQAFTSLIKNYKKFLKLSQLLK